MDVITARESITEKLKTAGFSHSSEDPDGYGFAVRGGRLDTLTVVVNYHSGEFRASEARAILKELETWAEVTRAGASASTHSSYVTFTYRP